MINPFVKILLFPFVLLYGLVVSCRNLLFNLSILKQCTFSIPVISIGNLSVGGTGKTPHTEYLIRLLVSNNKVAVLSRGYKRTSKGYVLATDGSTATDVGDEPYQIKKKFPEITVAVDADRCHGIDLLLKTEKPDVVLLDDAYQHRYVKPGLSILLTDYSNLFSRDYMLPMGRLREPRCNKKRADVIIVTKCPENSDKEIFQLIRNEISPGLHQQLYFSTFVYDDIKAVFPQSVENPYTLNDNISDILLVTGIVSPTQLQHYLTACSNNVTSVTYPDHHMFSAKDIEDILNQFGQLKSNPKIIVVTEKDAARLMNMNLPAEIKKSLYSIGIQVKILEGKENQFNQKIRHYVSENKRNS